MKSYKVLAAISLYPGTVVQLTKEQAEPRSHALERQGKGGTFTVTQPIQFKAGETFKTDSELPKVLAERIEPEKVQTSARDTGGRPRGVSSGSASGATGDAGGSGDTAGADSAGGAGAVSGGEGTDSSNTSDAAGGTEGTAQGPDKR